MDNCEDNELKRRAKIRNEVEEALKREEVIHSIEHLVETTLGEVKIEQVHYDYTYRELKVTFLMEGFKSEGEKGEKGEKVEKVTQTILFKDKRSFLTIKGGLMFGVNLSEGSCNNFQSFKSLIHKQLRTVEEEERLRETYNAIDNKILDLAYTQSKINSSKVVYLVSEPSFYSVQKFLGMKGIVPVSVGKIMLINGLEVKMHSKLSGLEVAIEL